MCNCPIPFLVQNDSESIGNLNYSWRQVSILRMRMRGMENIKIKNFVLISKQKKSLAQEVRQKSDIWKR